MNLRHGDSGTRFYNIWYKMLTRCKDVNDRYYKNNIIVCDRWKEYKNFKYDMFEEYEIHANKYSEKETTIDRINVFGNYEPSNCRWATYKEQAMNRTTNIVVEYEGMQYKVQELCEKFNLDRGMVNTRLKNKWDIKEIVEIPSNISNRIKINKIEYLGYNFSISQWSNITGILPCTIRIRLNRGWDTDRTLDYITKGEIEKYVF